VPGREPRPFLKWAGGKRQLLPQFRRFYPESFLTYHEPFLGSGAVFFDLWNLGKLDGRRAILTDDNADLIGCYLRVRDAASGVIAALDRLADGHERRGRAHYYEVRDDEFNPARRAWRSAGAQPASYGAELAAMLIYLNRTGFNGLFRLNGDGDFNVPAGRYDHPRIVDADCVRAVSGVLASPSVEILESRFETVVARAREGDFVYLDPPYAPLTRTAQFTSYTSRGFDHDDQRRLAEIAVKLCTRRVHVMLSNSTAPAVSSLYEHNVTARRAGLRAYRVPARRAINSNAGRRGLIEELLVTNLAPVG
jgi:DNA adenine methylase